MTPTRTSRSRLSPGRAKRTRQRNQGRPKAPDLAPEALDDLAERIGHRFKDTALLTRALTHPSAVSHRKAAVKGSYQRLEFLGDRVLGLVMAERLFERYPNEREGDLAPRLNQLVNKGACAAAADRMALGPHIIMSRHEIEQGGQARESTLGDVCESMIGALYLDGGLGVAARFIERAWAPQFATLRGRTKDPKTALQEYTQARGAPPPDYTVAARTGPDHAPRFKVRARIEGVSVEAEGASKQEAERLAAELILADVDPGGEG